MHLLCPFIYGLAGLLIWKHLMLISDVLMRCCLSDENDKKIVRLLKEDSEIMLKKKNGTFGRQNLIKMKYPLFVVKKHNYLYTNAKRKDVELNDSIRVENFQVEIMDEEKGTTGLKLEKFSKPTLKASTSFFAEKASLETGLNEDSEEKNSQAFKSMISGEGIQIELDEDLKLETEKIKKKFKKRLKTKNKSEKVISKTNKLSLKEKNKSEK